MRLPNAAMLALTCLPLTVEAQDIGAEYAAAYTIFGHTTPDLETAQAAIAALIPTLAGRWIPIDILMGGGLTTPVPVDTTRFCSGIVYDLAPTGTYSFAMIQLNLLRDDTPLLTTQYGYAGMNNFQRFVDEVEFLNRMGFGDGSVPPPNIFFVGTQMARVKLYNPSRNILVLVAEQGVVQYFARCP